MPLADVTDTSALVIPAQTNIDVLTLWNPEGASQTIYYRFGRDVSVGGSADAGIPLAAGEVHTYPLLDRGRRYNAGGVYAIHGDAGQTHSLGWDVA